MYALAWIWVKFDGFLGCILGLNLILLGSRDFFVWFSDINLEPLIFIDEFYFLKKKIPKGQ